MLSAVGICRRCGKSFLRSGRRTTYCRACGEVRAAWSADTDPRYKTRLWQETRLRVLRRDLWACYVAGCDQTGNVADHIIPVYPGMPASQFYGLDNLRASCRRHNTARGVAARLERETAGIQAAPRRRRTIYG